MRVIREVGPLDDNDFEITTNDSLAGTFDGFTALLYGLGFVVGFITLAGAGIGVMNIMLVSVTERTREIGVRKSVGATKKAIITQFLMEAVFICQVGDLSEWYLEFLVEIWLPFGLKRIWLFQWNGYLGAFLEC